MPISSAFLLTEGFFINAVHLVNNSGIIFVILLYYVSCGYSIIGPHNISFKQKLSLLLLNTTCPVLANSVDPDQLASEEAN